MMDDPPPGTHAVQVNNDLTKWIGTIAGPAGTPYEGALRAARCDERLASLLASFTADATEGPRGVMKHRGQRAKHVEQQFLFAQPVKKEGDQPVKKEGSPRRPPPPPP